MILSTTILKRKPFIGVYQESVYMSGFNLRKKRNGREKKIISKQKLLKGCHHGQNVTVLAILERLDVPWPLHFEMHFAGPVFNFLCTKKKQEMDLSTKISPRKLRYIRNIPKCMSFTYVLLLFYGLLNLTG